MEEQKRYGYFPHLFCPLLFINKAYQQNFTC
ncbi:hypothetical protein BCE_3800 [Bacillus cereus ATCC 10987]|uniref:Uncharacterized protein n=1 Tax=Bacillus cereus (strain ATCC 10987 / NRS 248) TaxID=222523 RepID=Q732W0_BACC1|nr:hypothetical protein BCE_3800 [Bacillus cereus ATCC 10987]